MKTVVITGSARGLGLEMAKVFKKNNFNVVISDLSMDKLNNAKNILDNIKSSSNVLSIICNVTYKEDIDNLIEMTDKTFGSIDIWINNAGVNQPNKAIWELSKEEIDMIIDVDLKGSIVASKLVMNYMIKQGYGAIYNVEGYGSNDAMMLGLSLYGTSKRAITYFTDSLAKEINTRNLNIVVGKLSPGIMITDFITNALGNKEKIILDEKTKKVYNILGDYPDVISLYLVNKMINNTKNGIRINWLPNSKAFYRFLTAGFNKRNFFK